MKQPVNRMLSLLLVVVMIVGISILPCATIPSSAAETFVFENYEYSLADDETIVIEKYIGSEETVIIPSEIDGKPVRKIETYAFYNKSCILEIIIPEGITHLSGWAFSDLNYLQSITVPASVTNILGNPFFKCARLENIAVAGGNRNYCSVDGILFDVNMETLISYPTGRKNKEYSIPNGIKCLGRFAFYGEKSLEKIVIPDSVTEIQYDAFFACSNLATIEISKNITTIGTDAFSRTAYYNNTTNWHNNILYIDNYLINVAEKISGTCVVKDGTTVVADHAFSSKVGFREVVFPDSVTVLGEGTFYINDHIRKVVIGSGVTVIEDSTFEDCTNLESVTFTKSITKIGHSAFADCGVSDIYYTGSEAEWSKIKISPNNYRLESAKIHHNFINGEQQCNGNHVWDVLSGGNFFICTKCQKQQPVSPVAGYEFGRDSFSFSNSDVGNYDISWGAYKDHMNLLMKTDIISLFANGISRFVKLVSTGDSFGGVCFGMATMNASFASNIPVSSYGGNIVHELSISNADASLIGNNDTKLKDSINIMYAAQSLVPVVLFQGVQHMDSKKTAKDIVQVAQSLTAGTYLPIVCFKSQFGGHAVNIIGIMPYDFVDGYYLITTYDSNRPLEPGWFLISKDYSQGYYCYSDGAGGYNNYLVEDFSYIITSKSFNIDYFAPGLRACNLCYNNSFVNRVGSSSVQLNENFDAGYNDEDYINYAILSNAELTLTDANGGYFTIQNGEIVSTNLETVYVIPILGTNLTRVTVPYNGSEYTVTSDDDYYIHMNYNHQNTALYCENGGELKGTIAETIRFTPKSSESTFDISYYAADLFTNSDVIGCTFTGSGSNFMANLTGDGIIVEDADFESLGFSVRHNDDELTVEDVILEKDSAIQNITIGCTDNEVVLEYEKEIAVPELPTEPETPTDPDVPTDPETPDEPTGDTPDCSCLCHSKNGFMQFVYKLVRFFWQLFGMNMDCACGAKHFDSYFFG